MEERRKEDLLYKVLTIEGYAEAYGLWNNMEDRESYEDEFRKLEKVLMSAHRAKEAAARKAEGSVFWMLEKHPGEKIPYPLLENELRLVHELLKKIAGEAYDGIQ